MGGNSPGLESSAGGTLNYLKKARIKSVLSGFPVPQEYLTRRRHTDPALIG